MKIELKIELLGTDQPKVWRQIKVRPDLTFDQLHQVIQAAFGWANSHLYMFSEHGFGDLITINSPYDDEGGINAENILADSILMALYNSAIFNKENPQKLKYIYDFGDNWEHDITAIGFDRDAKGKAEIVAGGGACPPEDCGGLHGFADIKKSLKTGKPSAIHGESWLPWLKEMGLRNYDPNVFDLKAAERRLKKVGV
jgi:Plasmid pRiA4b ORF-3-like protein